MVAVRSVLFNALFYLTLAVYLIAALPTLLLPRWGIIAFAKSWARTSLRLLRVVAGIRVEFHGTEKIPRGAVLVAAKHQSALETFALLPLFDDPAFIIKRELMWIPLFGWYTWKAGMIPVDRGAGSQALAAMTARTREAFDEGRQLIIFPEGTRRAPGAEPAYKFGVAHLYADTGVTCLPVALNSGLAWSRRSFRRMPGTVRIEFLDPIPPGLDKQAFFTQLKDAMENATKRLLAEGATMSSVDGAARTSAGGAA